MQGEHRALFLGADAVRRERHSTTNDVAGRVNQEGE